MLWVDSAGGVSVGNRAGYLLPITDMPGPVFRRQPPVSHTDVLAPAVIGCTTAGGLSWGRGLPEGLTRRPGSEEEQEPDSLSLGRCLGARQRGQSDAGGDKKHSGDSQCSEPVCHLTPP
jgi:hypothetical protein